MDSIPSYSDGETKKVAMMMHNTSSKNNNDDDPFASLVNMSTVHEVPMSDTKEEDVEKINETVSMDGMEQGGENHVPSSDVFDTNVILKNDNHIMDTTTAQPVEEKQSCDMDSFILDNIEQEKSENIPTDHDQTNTMMKEIDETLPSIKQDAYDANHTLENGPMISDDMNHDQDLSSYTNEMAQTQHDIRSSQENVEAMEPPPLLDVDSDLSTNLITLDTNESKSIEINDNLMNKITNNETAENTEMKEDMAEESSTKSLDDSNQKDEKQNLNEKIHDSPPLSPTNKKQNLNEKIHESPPLSPTNNPFRNRLALLKSRADAVLQSSEVLKAAQSRADQVLSSSVIRSAQKNIEEKRKEVQKVVEERVLNNRHWQSHDQENSNGSYLKSNPTENGAEMSENIRNATIPDDDISFSTKDSMHSKSIESDASSVCIDSDDSMSDYSDESSVYIPEARKATINHQENPAFPDTNPTPIKSNLRSSVVQPSYHGRYGDPNRPPKQSREHMLRQLSGKVRKPSPPVRRPSNNNTARHESQTALINRTLPAPQFKALIKSLKKGQYVMLLGNGMLGVNLKQTYLSGHGVYVDFVAPGGNAEKSGVICVGDALVKVGDEDVSKGTIFNVPEIIAKTKRPCVIVLNGEHNVEWKDMDYIDVAIGMVNHILSDSKQVSKSALFGKAESQSCPDISLAEKNLSLQKFTVPRAPVAELRKSMSEFSGKRNNRSASVSALSYSCKEDKQFKHVLREAFLTCCMDSRRLPFFAAFLSNEESFTMQRSDFPSNVTSNTKLMLYLELLSFRDVFDVASPQRRFDHAKQIAFKFLVSPEENGHPSFDLRSIFSFDELAQLRQAVFSVTADTIKIGFFHEIEKCLEQALAGATFASFLLSDDCARMRAYMRGTSPFVDAPLDDIMTAASDYKSSFRDAARNHLSYIILYLLCKVENDTMDKNYIDRSSLHGEGNDSKRLKGAVGAMSCAIYIDKVLMLDIENSNKPEVEYTKQLIEKFEIFWESFLAPYGGILETSSHSNDTYKSIEKVRKAMFMMAQSPPKQLTESLNKLKMTESLMALQKDLVYDYCVNDHPKFRSHKIHEWMCYESKQLIQDDLGNMELETVPRLPKGCISRLIRKIEVPEGVSRHSPMHSVHPTKSIQAECLESSLELNADYAVIFCSSEDTHDRPVQPQDNNTPPYVTQSMKRTAFVPLTKYAKIQLEDKTVDQILPMTMESYVMIPPFRQRPFKQSLYYGRKSRDGWEISLVNFMVPYSAGTTSSNSNFLYGVSLVLNKVHVGDDKKIIKDKGIALALISERCVIPSMRKTLYHLFEEKVVSKPHSGNCAELVTMLETFDTGSESKLVEMLEPHIQTGSVESDSRSAMEQDQAFETASVHVLVESLPPISLSLLFITAILEQKVVFTSSRRSTLVSMVIALRSLLRPLQWPHLIVPTAPSALTRDLLQYPAPFLLGIALDNQESMDVLKSIPSDITLVDVDVGRIILAQKLTHHYDTSDTDKNGRPISMSLRSQVLHLAELLGNIIGLHQSNSIWRSDSPIISSVVDMKFDPQQKVEATRTICHSFLRELISGLNTCCYWIEEQGCDGDPECHILFDEDRFLELKRMRGNGKYAPLFSNLSVDVNVPILETRSPLALNADDFNLVLETFLRGQGLSTYISSQKKETLVYW